MDELEAYVYLLYGTRGPIQAKQRTMCLFFDRAMPHEALQKGMNLGK